MIMSAVAKLVATGTFHKVARRSSALTSGSWGCGSSGSQKKITMSMSPSAILAPICWSPPSGPDSLYFNVETVGNASSASIPLAIYDAVRDGVIKEPTRILAPGFGAGAVAGYCVMRIDPAVVAISVDVPAEPGLSPQTSGQRLPEP